MPSSRSSRARRLLAVGAAAALVLAGASLGTAGAAAAATGVPAGASLPKMLPRTTDGPTALKTLGPAEVAAAAAQVGRSARELTSILSTDSTARLGTTGRLLFQDKVNPQAGVAVPPVARGPFPNGDTFLLHSRPGSHRILFLDFDGYALPAGTGWHGGTAFTALPYDTDGAPATFGQAEIDTIQSLWQRVAEDYAPFDIDVTTQTPTAAALRRADAADDFYGGSAVITNSPNSSMCATGCSGVSYVGIIDEVGTSWDFFQPSWVFPDGSGPGAQNIAYPTSHEFGHAAGLSHDGQTNGTEYYPGHGSWAPIMGSTFGQPVTQWSKGEYPLANNTEDDYVVMAANGLAAVADETGGGLSPTVDLVPGATQMVGITPAGDIDTFRYVAACTGSYTFTANPAPVSPNLSLILQLYNFGAALLGQDATQPTEVNQDTMSSMGGSLTQALTAGSAYTVGILPLANGTAATGWTNYGNVGQYSIAVTTPAGCGTPPNDAFAAAQALSGETGTASGTNVNGTRQTGEPLIAGNAGGHSIWYSYVAPATGTLTVDTCAASYDTLLGVYTGTAVNALTLVGDNDDSAVCTTNVNGSRVVVPVTSGTGYRLAVDGFNGATGTIGLSFAFTPTNDAFAAAQVLPGTSGTVAGTNVGGTKETGEPSPAANAGGKSVWYSYTPASAGTLHVETCGSGFDTLLGVYTGGAVNALTEQASNDDFCGLQSSVDVPVTAGTPYRILVDGFNNGGGAVSGAVSLTYAFTGAGPVVSIGDASVVEGDNTGRLASFAVRLSQPAAGPVTVAFATSNGTATTAAPADYSAKTGTLTIAAGVTNAAVTVQALGDGRVEPDETFAVTLSAPTGAALGRSVATGTIINDDGAAGSPRMSIGDVSVSEGNAGTSVATFDVTLDQASAVAVSASWATAFGTATAADFTAASGGISFAPGTTSTTISVTVTGDALDEVDEAGAVNLSAPTNAVLADASGALTILDDDPGALTAISVGDVSVTEGDTVNHLATFPVRLKQAFGTAVTVQYTTVGAGTATPTADFTAKTGTLTIPAGQTSGKIPVSIVADGLPEGAETIKLTLSAPTGGATLGRAVGTATIVDDDPAIALQVSVGDATMTEGNSGAGKLIAVITLNRPSASPVTVRATTTNGTATSGSDYTIVNKVFTIAAGKVAVNVPITTAADATAEGNETITITLSTPTGAVINRAVGTGTLLNDD